MMKPANLTALLVLCLLWMGAATSHAETYDLAKFDPGDHVTGPKLSGKHIKGKIVVVEYWGITCGPCIRSIPHTTELAKKYGHDKLIIIANQSWSASDRQVRETWNEHAKNNMVMVVNGGKLKGFEPQGVPHALVFDHTGKSIWEGHPASMDLAIAEAIKNLPEPAEEPAKEDTAEQETGPAPIVAGFEPKAFLGEVRLINAQNRNITSTLAKLRRAAERSSRQEQMDEAKLIVTAVEAWANAQQAQAESAMKDDPATAYQAATELVELLQGDELAKRCAQIIAEIEKDHDRFDNVRATLALRNILAEANAIGLDRDKSALDDKKNARTVRLITRDLDRLVKAYPETEAGKQAKTLQAKWGLDE